MLKRAYGALLAAIVLVISACANPLEGGGEGGSSGEIIIGASDVGETTVLAHLYAGVLRKAGAHEVTVRPPVGSREVVVKALQDKSLTLVPDYTGNLLRYFDENSEATKPDDVYRELTEKLPPQYQVLDRAPAQDKDVLVVPDELAKTGLRTVSDLGPRCRDLVFGGPGQWADRWQEKIKSIYGCEFKRIDITDPSGPVTVDALRKNEVQVADMFSTSPRIAANGFVPLDDDKNMFPAQNIVPVAAANALSGREQRALNELSAVLTTEKLTQLDVEYTEQKRNPLDIADDFLAESGLA